jgi:ribonuclease BN (tRNA processing enzyme)
MTFWKGRLGIAFNLTLILLLLSACQKPEPSAQTLTESALGQAHQETHNNDLLSPELSAQQCRQHELALQILGSGGPIADDERASSAYVIWHRGKSVALIDFGGGAFARFGAAGADLAELEFIALSHFHTDHSAGIPALMKSAYFSQRERPLTLLGPSGSPNRSATKPGQFPALPEYLNSLFAPGRGAFRYLAGLLDGSDGLFELSALTVDASEGQQSTLEVPGPIKLSALGVHHGIVPALAYRLEVDGRTIVFSGDQSRFNPAMASFSRGADVLVAHIAIPQDAGNIAKRLHRTPESWGQLAAEAEADELVLSHWMQRSLREQAENVAWVQKNYSGSVHIASDLDCIVL